MDYSALIPDAKAFCTSLAANNTKDWWLAHKSTYDERLKAPALALIDDLSPLLADLAGDPVSGKLFRPHRDVRFSKDKTPYKTHLHMMWSIKGGGRQDPVFFFGIGTDYVTFGTGLMGFDKEVLADWRKFVDLDAAHAASVVAGLEASGFAFREPDLARVPSPFPTDHRNARLLRMKGCVATRELMPLGGRSLPDAILAAARDALPLTRFLLTVSHA